MKIEIKNRWNGKVIFECDALSIRAAVELAVEKRISLRDADLRAADLRAADLSDADLRAADLSAANLRDADLRAANLRAADLSAANLRDADLRAANLSAANLSAANLSAADLSAANLSAANLSAADLRAADLSDADLSAADLSAANLSAANLSAADLRAADLSDADLSAANLSDADLRAADLRDADLRAAQKDFLTKLAKAKEESIGLYKALLEGKIDGSCYEGECACFCGTIANIKGIHYEKLKEVSGIVPSGASPVERWFLGISKGDTPENNPVSAITKGWMEEFMKEHGLAIPKRVVNWS